MAGLAKRWVFIGDARRCCFSQTVTGSEVSIHEEGSRWSMLPVASEDAPSSADLERANRHGEGRKERRRLFFSTLLFQELVRRFRDCIARMTLNIQAQKRGEKKGNTRIRYNIEKRTLRTNWVSESLPWSASSTGVKCGQVFLFSHCFLRAVWRFSWTDLTKRSQGIHTTYTQYRYNFERNYRHI